MGVLHPEITWWVFFCIVKVQCLVKVNVYSINKPAPVFAQSRNSKVPEPIGHDRDAPLTTVSHVAVMFASLIMSDLWGITPDSLA